MDDSTNENYGDKNEQDVFNNVDDLLDDGHNLQAYNLLELHSPSPTEKVGWLYRAAAACYNQGCSEDFGINRLEWFEKAHDYALEAHQLEPMDVDVLAVLCSSTGKLAEDSNLADKIKYGFEFQKYLDDAIANYPDSYEFLHMRGRFHFQVSTLSAVEKEAAESIGSLPNASLKCAIEDLIAANNVYPDKIENIFFIGKTYDAMGDYEDAKIYLGKVLEISRDPNSVVEREYVDEAKAILESVNYS